MARPRLSITLPSNFEFHYSDGALPKTPEQREKQQSAIEPPPPPRQTYKLRRRRVTATMLPEEPPLLSDTDTVIPTIEMSEAVSELSSPMLQPTTSSDGLLAPLPTIQCLVTPPKTPDARMNPFTPAASPAHEWALINDSRDNKQPAFKRSESVCSSFSDSSVSSCGSSAFSAPNNGSCTSPESVATDPFMEDDITKAEKLFLSPDQGSDSPIAKRMKRRRHVKWTSEMDHHLENTYIMYLRDPRVTPFKMLPGIPPPLGVCSRVANKARRTWGQRRSSTPSPLDTILEAEKLAREGSPDTIRPDTAGDKHPRHQASWPSDAGTRKRLRKLVKGKPALSAHYQRLLRTRSPSPFSSSSAPSRSSEPLSTFFSGRDLKMSLITSTAPSMQPEAPLAQLASDETDPDTERPKSRRISRPANWFERIGRGQAHQKSLSLQSGLSLEAPRPSSSLASPFDELSNRSHLLHSMSTTKSLGRTEFKGKHGKVPSLDSPIEMTGAPTAPRSLKRRFKSDEEKPRRPAIGDVFAPPAEDAGIVRNRGFTVSAVRATDNLARIFEPPSEPSSSSVDQEMTEAPPVPEVSFLGPVGSRSAPRRLAEPTPRLGSPFMETPATNRLFNTFPRSYIPTASNPQPFQERLRELAAQHQQD
ncbi:hypothetical protein LTR37_010566 [Vermiconidia calcicola]|uniref:Uncharacterized protein n=1 Tax=Vermiconidia calcicola TaxID=1690605 RepID=A0ACC3N4N6_9PEZI|nr:hypothetical protein LTR37_010566 [Vermiconidia calcicola]